MADPAGGSEFHSAADGVEALAAIQAELAGVTGVGVGGTSGPSGGGRTRRGDLHLSGHTPRPARREPAGRTRADGAHRTIRGGKTTLLEVICGIRQPEAGTVRAPACHLVTQQPFLPTGTLRRLLTLGNDAGPPAIWEALRATSGSTGVAATAGRARERGRRRRVRAVGGQQARCWGWRGHSWRRVR